MLIVIITIIVLFVVTVAIYIQQPQFGKAPSGKRLERIKKSPNYKNGKFQNIEETKLLPEGYTMAGEVWRTFFGKNPRKFPTDVIPSTKVNILDIPNDEDVLIWFGHSSYYLQVSGKKILVDPVLSGSASPLPFGVKAFKGSDRYTTEDFSIIDYVLISHDHFDHVDYKTLLALKPKIKHLVCGLGVGESFEYWGFKPEQILEKDWNETIVGDNGFKIHTTTARHGSGRKTSSDNTLWISYLIDAPTKKIFVGGDSGYGKHFAEIGNKFGPIDLAILDNGQYGETTYSSIHMPPKFALMAAKDLKAKRLFPVHSSKFVLSRHPWDEPLVLITELANDAKIPLVTPMIGEKVDLDDTSRIFKPWWKGIN